MVNVTILGLYSLTKYTAERHSKQWKAMMTAVGWPQSTAPLCFWRKKPNFNIQKICVKVKLFWKIIQISTFRNSENVHIHLHTQAVSQDKWFTDSELNAPAAGSKQNINLGICWPKAAHNNWLLDTHKYTILTVPEANDMISTSTGVPQLYYFW